MLTPNQNGYVQHPSLKSPPPPISPWGQFLKVLRTLKIIIAFIPNEKAEKGCIHRLSFSMPQLLNY